MRQVRALLYLALLLIVGIRGVQAQGLGFEIAYGETQNNVFQPDSTVDSLFVLDAQPRDMLRIRVFRIGGQFTPSLRLLTGDGTELAVSPVSDFSDMAEITYLDGLPESDFGYQIEVQRPDTSSDDVFNPPEYSVTLEYLGRRRDPNEDILPRFDNPPTLEQGASQTLAGIPVFAEAPETQQTNNGTVISSIGWNLTVNPRVANGVSSASFLDNGIGLSIRRGMDSVFFSDQNFAVFYDTDTGLYTFTIANFDGTTTRIVISDFSRIEWIQALSGVVTVAMLNSDNIEKRLVFNNDYIDIRSVSNLYEIKIGENGQFVRTDMRGWDTLAYYDNQLRVYYGQDGRFISDTAFYLINQDNNNPQLTDIAWLESQNPTASRIDMQIDWQGFGDVEVADGQLKIVDLLQHETITPLSQLFHTVDPSLSDKAVLIKSGAILLSKGSGANRTYLSVFPDGTQIETPSVLNEDFSLLPYQAGFRTRNYNNLGDNILPICRCIESIEPMIPVNPANGNFFYKVNDFLFPGHQLQLELTRYYNSQGTNLIPQYLLDSPVLYPHLGIGWRHSYQYELNISTAPLGRIQFIEPDGTGHYFTLRDSTTNVWRSATLLSMTIIQENGVLGSWRAETTDGLSYYFDRVGRLTRISISPKQSITIVPTLSSPDTGTGIIIVEPYGRRIELATDDSGLVQQARDADDRRITYNYIGDNLTSVAYDVASIHTAAYDYSDNLLVHFDDVRSPYLQVGTINYDNERRVVRFIENPNTELSPDYRYTYSTTADGESTTREITVSGQIRPTTWTYNKDYQLTTLALPREGWVYTFSYDNNSGTLRSIRIPTLVSFNFSFDDRGNLTEFQDPTRPVAYSFRYVSRGNRSLLAQIDYPSNRVDNFEWSDDPNPKLVEHRTVVFRGVTDTIRTTRYVYDDWERLALVVELDDPSTDDNAGNIGTLYQYDSFGYVSEIQQGLKLQAEQIDKIRAAQDVLPEIISSIEPLRVVKLDYDQFGQLVSFGDGNNPLSLSWEDNQLHQIINTSDNSTLLDYEYDARGRITSINDRGIVTRYLYNGLDRVITMVSAADTSEEDRLDFRYDTAGNLLSVRDDLRRTTSFTYDTLNNLIQRTLPSGAQYNYQIAIDPRGLLLRQETDPTGRVIERQYDAVGRMQDYRITGAGGFEQDFSIEYNSASNPTRILETNSNYEMDILYNFVGDVREITVEGSTTKFAYNDHGYLVSRTSPGGRTNNYAYDALGNIVSVTLPEGGIWQYTYDSNNNLSSAVDPNGLKTQYVYDDFNRVKTITDPQGHAQTFDYDTYGNLTGITDARDGFRSFEYDARNNLKTSVDELGQRTRYNYDNVGRLIGLSPQPVISFTYDSDDNIIGVTQISSARTLYSYDPLGRITSITDPLGHTTSYQYNPVGRITKIIDPIGNEQNFDWQSGTMFLQGYTNALGQKFDVRTDGTSGRVTMIQPEDNSLNTYLSYDPTGDAYIANLTIASDANFNDGNASNDLAYHYTYDGNGNVTTYTDPTGGLWQLKYDLGSRLTEMVYPNGSFARYKYENNSAQVTKVEYYEEGADTPYSSESYEYDENGNLVGYVSPNEIKNQYFYDIGNRLRRTTLAVGTDVEKSYSFNYGLGFTSHSIINPLGDTTTYYYQLDNIARMEQKVGDNQSHNVYFDFDVAGNLTKILLSPFTNESDQSIEINQTYNALNRRVRYVDSEKKSWSYTYDATGNLIQVSDPLGAVVAYSYNDYNRVTRIEYPSHNAVTLKYDGVGNLSSIVLPPNQSNNQQEIFYQLDPSGHIIQTGSNVQIFNNSGLRYSYDKMGHVVKRLAPDNRETDYNYDTAGNLSAIHYPDSTINYSYDKEGHLLKAGNDNFSSSYTYDSLGQLKNANENGMQFDYSYDAVGNLTDLQASGEGLNTDIARHYVYDEFNHLSQVQFQDKSICFEYNELGLVTTIKRSNSPDCNNDSTINTVTDYDLTGRPISIAHNSGPRITDAVDTYKFEYDAVGNLIRVERLDNSIILYSYDVDHRLISERWLNGSDETIHVVSFRYDAVGNRIEEIRNGQRTTFNYDEQNRLTSEVRNAASQRTTAFLLPMLFGFGMVFMLRRRRRWWLLPGLLIMVGVAFAQTGSSQTIIDYSYDLNGNLTRIAYRNGETFVLNLSYDAENRLIAVKGQNEKGETVDTELVYDQFSRLVEWRSNGADYSLFYNGDTLFAMRDNSNDTFEEFLYVDNQLLFTQKGDEGLWNLNDQIGSTRRYVNEQGQLLDDPSQQFEFGSFGVRLFADNLATDSSQVVPPTILFGGHLYDSSTGLYLMGLRAYDPVTGRFIQPDPIRQDPIGSLYTYARNRPFVFNDSNGLTVQPYVEPLNAAILRDEIKPESIIPRPNLPDFPVPPSVSRLQTDESFRAFRLLKQLRYGTNSVVGQLSPLMDDFYLFNFNPIPDNIKQLSAEPLSRVMSIYQVGDGWMPDPRPNPTITVNPFDQIRKIEPVLAQAYIQPLQWTYGKTALTSVLPSVLTPKGLSNRDQLENGLTKLLQPISLMTALGPETSHLLDLSSFTNVPLLPKVDVTLPSAPIEPPVLDDLDTLRQQSFDFYSRILPPQFNCETCTKPLGFNR